MTATLTIRLKQEEKKALEKLAGRGKISPWVRKLIQAQIGQPQKVDWSEHFRKMKGLKPISTEEVDAWFRQTRR